jgi:adenylate cyclase
LRVTDGLFDWLLDGVPGVRQSSEVAERIGVELVAAGIPLDRLVVWVTTLHPTVAGREFAWRPGEPATVRDLAIAAGGSPAFKVSPVAVVFETRRELRRRIDDAAASEFPVLAELKAHGYTDYLCAPLLFTNGEVHGAAFATRHPLGFSDAHLDRIRHILRPLARIAEIFALRRIATNLLSTYVGHDSGARILAGRITRGDVETLHAVIWFSDLRGFTAMSSTRSPHEMIGVLNELFDCQVPAIDKHGGEVLKFIGDGLLAIFPFVNEGDVGKRCADALTAAREAFAALDAHNAAALTPIQFGLALHVGEVAYGNIGGAQRLDFTAIGPAVNLAARLESLTGKLGRRIVLSSELATHATVPLVELGAFELKGVPGAPRVFGLAAE